MKNVAILGIVIASSIAAIGFSVTDAIPQQCLLKEEKSALDTFMSEWRNYVYTTLPIEIQDPIFNTYKELVKLPVCENMKNYVKKELRLVETYTGAMASAAPDLQYMEKLYINEGFGSHELREKLFKNYVLPFPESLKEETKEIKDTTQQLVDPCENLPPDECFEKWLSDSEKSFPFTMGFITFPNLYKSDYNATELSKIPTENPQDVAIMWVGCSKTTIVQPAFKISSDVETKIQQLHGVLPSQFCTFQQSIMIKAKDPFSIKISYFESRPDPSTRGIKIIEAKQISATDIYSLLIKVCAGKTALDQETIVLSSDKESKDLVINAKIGAGSCYTDTAKIHADDPAFIAAQFKDEQLDSVKSLREELELIKSQLNKPTIPKWIKNNAKWWADKQIGDTDFVQGIQYLITQEIIKIPETKTGSGTSQEIPTWIRNNAKWWADGQISDDDFISGIQYLISNGIMKIK